MRLWTSLQTKWVKRTMEPFCNLPSLTKWFFWVANMPCCWWVPSERTTLYLSVLLLLVGCCWALVTTCITSITCSIGFTPSSSAFSSPLHIFIIAPSVRFIAICTVERDWDFEREREREKRTLEWKELEYERERKRKGFEIERETVLGKRVFVL